MSKVPVDPPATISTGTPACSISVARLHQRRERRVRGLAPRLPAHDVRAVARVALEPAEAERRLARPRRAPAPAPARRERCRCAGFPRRRPRSTLTVTPVRVARPRPRSATFDRVIDHDQRVGRRRDELHEPADRGGCHDLGRDQEPANAGPRHHLGLAELGAGDAERARAHLAAGDLGAAMRLRVGPEVLAGRARVRGHAAEVAARSDRGRAAARVLESSSRVIGAGCAAGCRWSRRSRDPGAGAPAQSVSRITAPRRAASARTRPPRCAASRIAWLRSASGRTIGRGGFASRVSSRGAGVSAGRELPERAPPIPPAQSRRGLRRSRTRVTMPVQYTRPASSRHADLGRSARSGRRAGADSARRACGRALRPRARSPRAARSP